MHTFGRDQDNRAEVPDICELRLLMALAARKGWSLGSLDVITAFLYAALDDAEDGIYLVQPPEFLVKQGYIRRGVLWKLKKALCGLRKTPTMWQDERDKQLRSTTFIFQDQECSLVQCSSAKKNVWKFCSNEIGCNKKGTEGEAVVGVPRGTGPQGSDTSTDNNTGPPTFGWATRDAIYLEMYPHAEWV